MGWSYDAIQGFHLSHNIHRCIYPLKASTQVVKPELNIVLGAMTLLSFHWMFPVWQTRALSRIVNFLLFFNSTSVNGYSQLVLNLCLFPGMLQNSAPLGLYKDQFMDCQGHLHIKGVILHSMSKYCNLQGIPCITGPAGSAKIIPLNWNMLACHSLWTFN